MRTSRIAKDTASLVEGAASTARSSPRRTTRSSLARFSYNDTSSDATTTIAASTSLPDIEDVADTKPRKRRRVTKANVASETTVKHENKEETSPSDLKAQSPTPEATTTTTPKKRRKPARVIKGSSPSSTRVEPPSDWEDMYELIRKMRLDGPAKDAPVDTMGCERLYAPDANERDKRFHILIALMLSSQTKDTVNAVAMGRLHTELPPHEPGAPWGLNLENVLAVEPAKLNELIHQVGFHNNKTKFIKQAALLLRDDHASDIPSSIQGLVSLPGVGPKMAHLCLSAAWHRTEGIGVDVHVHRLTNLWGWNKTANPEATRLTLESWLPQDKWHEINTLLVGLGQTVCPPQAGSRKCGECTLGLGGWCKAADRKKVAAGRRAMKEEEEEEEVVDGVMVTKTEAAVEVKKEEDVMDGLGPEVKSQTKEGGIVTDDVVSVKTEPVSVTGNSGIDAENAAGAASFAAATTTVIKQEEVEHGVVRSAMAPEMEDAAAYKRSSQRERPLESVPAPRRGRHAAAAAT